MFLVEWSYGPGSRVISILCTNDTSRQVAEYWGKFLGAHAVVTTPLT